MNVAERALKQKGGESVGGMGWMGRTRSKLRSAGLYVPLRDTGRRRAEVVVCTGMETPPALPPSRP
jgi:hypothetical protein